VSAASIAVDNQAAIRALRRQKSGPGQHLVEAVHRLEENARRKHVGVVLTVRWVLGHLGVEVNESVDEEGKKAVQGNSSPANTIPAYSQRALPTSVSKLRQIHNT
jgi:ribonuclease HI